ncbi:hypothetical protein [Vibrio sp. OPT18]|uniref:hypothetical protein n=1 Tax=Vibrio sp. OPT18 TaxID=2778641 RepID=UPI001882DA0F|nr:hypothetical protein [Vibrio sp. OPT18]MBE8574449.1 hypothetical protein [Vibrio sp. OPT18]
MKEVGLISLFWSLIDATGLKKFFTCVVATVVSFDVTGLAQFIAIIIGIISGCMAIRHYAIATKLNKVKLEKLHKQNGGAS